ncbi:MAG: hypothetical protein ACOCYO_10330 [Bacteroidota bacterium]
MKTQENQYEMRVKQLSEDFFRLRLIDSKKRKDHVIFETFANTIPSTFELLIKYKMIRAQKYN